MQLELDQIKKIALGAVRITQEEDGIHFYRFTQEQEALYRARNQDFYKKSFSTTGVQLRFQTNSENLYLKAAVTPGSSRKYFAFEVFADGKRIGTLDNYSDTELPQAYASVVLPQGTFEKSFSLGAGGKEVRVVFPWSVKAILQEMVLDDGAELVPVKPKHKLLVFGDSITQGYDALLPSNKYITQVAEYLDAEEINKAIGAEIFFPELAATAEDFVPDYITVAYGTNDWFKCTEEEFRVNCAGFYRNLSMNYPSIPIFAITPIWRKEIATGSKFGAFENVEAIIREITKDLSNITVISGFTFVPQKEELFGDMRLHPNDKGFVYYYRNLKEAVARLLQKEA